MGQTEAIQVNIDGGALPIRAPPLGMADPTAHHQNQEYQGSNREAKPSAEERLQLLIAQTNGHHIHSSDQHGGGKSQGGHTTKPLTFAPLHPEGGCQCP